jgi:hypothetical protein
MRKVRRTGVSKPRKVRVAKMKVSKPRKASVPKPNFWHAR